LPPPGEDNLPPELPRNVHAAKLTPRELAVLHLLERGLSNKMIGKHLGMSPSTVKAHVHNIISKLNVRNRTEAAVARYARSAGANKTTADRIPDRQVTLQGDTC
jgi:DNA-binding NarL/FixJ family response regulator